MKIQDARSLPSVAQEDLRRKAVKAVIQEGQTRVDVARMFGVTRQAVGNWVKAYRQQGVKDQGIPKTCYERQLTQGCDTDSFFMPLTIEAA